MTSPAPREVAPREVGPREVGPREVIDAEVVRTPPPVAGHRPGNRWRELVDNRLLLLLLLYGATLALGLPLLWLSKALTRTEKWLHTVLLILWTLLVLAGFAWTMMWCVSRIRLAT